MTDTEQLPEAVAPIRTPVRGLPDPAWPVAAPTLAAWQHAWVDGTSWSEDEESDAEARPWPDFRSYIPAA
ncbi:hypothetical protein [Streptomyces sp. SID3212]|uniref:hypothetical protein n=1 Tax=unclassified Streptomyces TaxID=2593676 RepID=UPI00136C83D9|nr:hypothetical protein [Streptomyces sp. SID3212]MYV55574.1 hypothetical protein [Streptomyces sp. SID3212]